MGQNNDGIAGVDVENIAIEKTIVVGMQAPNQFPSMKIDENGRSLPVMEVAKNGGTQVLPQPAYQCSYVDTSWLAHCGKYTVSAGNKITFTSGGGGFEVINTGVTKFHTDYTDYICTHAFALTTRLFTVSVTKRMELCGERLDLIFEDTYIHGNVNFVKNVHINGGLYVNGEMMMQHMTTPSQMNLTDMSDKVDAYINPSQSFHVFNGASLAAKSLCQSAWAAASELPDSPAYIDALMAINFPSPIDKVLELPIKLAFPKGISLLSDAVFTLQPGSAAIATQGSNRPIGSGIKKPDVKGPAHQHSFKGPACKYTDDTAGIFEKAKKLTESNEPANAESAVPNGLESLEMFSDQVKQLAENEAKQWLKDMWDWINPFSNVTGGTT